MTFRYDLTREPWIPCLDLQGRRKLLGLRDVLAGAHALREVDGDTPLQTASLYRLLLAVLHRVFGPADLVAWATLWRNGRWESSRVDAYLDRWRERFDLFHPEKPFYQTADPRAIPKRLASFVPHVSSGNNPTLFDHQRDDVPVFYSPGEAARVLVAVQAYGIGGLSGIPRVSFTDGPCSRGILLLVEGKTLFETLALNLLRYPSDLVGLRTSPDDCPAWEMDTPIDPPREVPLGYLDYLTWHNRHIVLCPEILDGSLVVRECVAAPALRLDDAVRDPLMLWQASRGGGERPLAFCVERALWRDSSVLLGFGADNGSTQVPAALDQLRAVPYRTALSHSDFPMEPKIAGFGLVKTRAKVELTRTERLPVPLPYLENRDLVGDLAHALSLAEDVGRQVWSATQTLASYLVTPQLPPDQDRRTANRQRRDDLRRLQQHWAPDRFYWSALEVPFLYTLRTIPRDSDTALDAWVAALRREASAAFDLILRPLEHDPANLKAVVHAERRLMGGLKRVLWS